MKGHKSASQIVHRYDCVANEIIIGWHIVDNLDDSDNDINMTQYYPKTELDSNIALS